jgi:hypothetical protein
MKYVAARGFASRAKQYEVGDAVDIAELTEDERVEVISDGSVVPSRWVGTAAEIASNGSTPGAGTVVYETDTGVLRVGDGIVSSPSRVGSIVVREYTVPGTYIWTRPDGLRAVSVKCWSGGGGGGSGRRGAVSGTALVGGGGGAGGGYTEAVLPASQFMIFDTATIIVGAGGAGGAPVLTDDTNGSDGGYGNLSSFYTSTVPITSAITPAGSIRINAPSPTTSRGIGGGLASGGGGGTGQTSAIGSVSAAGGSASSSGTAGSAASTGHISPGAAGGGGGGGITAAGVSSPGGAGGLHSWLEGTVAATGGAAVGGSGSPPTAIAYGYVGGGGGGGGGASGSTPGGSGAAGGYPGGGGGGGGASANGYASGAGGAGGDGLVILIEYF